MRVVAIKARFTGLYGWGKGWLDKRIKETWYDYFRNLEDTVKPSLWSYFERGEAIKSQHLISVDSNVFLHPMDVCYLGNSSIVTKSANEKGEMVEVFPEVEELKDILTGAANACGGIVEFSDMVFGNIEEPIIKRR